MAANAANSALTPAPYSRQRGKFSYLQTSLASAVPLPLLPTRSQLAMLGGAAPAAARHAPERSADEEQLKSADVAEHAPRHPDRQCGGISAVRWYQRAISLAERRFADYVTTLKGRDTK